MCSDSVFDAHYNNIEHNNNSEAQLLLDTPALTWNTKLKAGLLCRQFVLSLFQMHFL